MVGGLIFWRSWDDEAVDPAQVGVARDADMVASVTQGVMPPIARLWTTQRAIIATAREGRSPGFADAARMLEAEGWPVALRVSGGSAFPTGPGILNLSLAFPRDVLREPSIETVYRILCAPIVAALAELGLDTSMGRAHGTFCAGGSDLLLGKRKIAGSAQSWRAGAARGGILAHAAILVFGDMREASLAVDRFHRRNGDVGKIDPNVAITVEEALGSTAKNRRDALMQLIRSGVRRAIRQTSV